MKKNNFDTIMDYIDRNISKEPEEIKKGIAKENGYGSNAIGNCFQLLTGETLFYYIRTRQMYFVSKKLQEGKAIKDIRFEDYGYSEQSAFSRAFKAFSGKTPKEVKESKEPIPDNKKRLIDICKGKYQYEQTIEKEEGDTGMPTRIWSHFEEIEEANKEYGFDVDTCDAILTLAYRLEIPFIHLFKICGDMVFDYKTQEDYFSPAIEAAIDLGIESSEELEKICEFYECKYYDIDVHMVNAYREQVNTNQ